MEGGGMSGSDYTRTPNLGLYKPTPNADVDAWGAHLNANADTLDAAVSNAGTKLAYIGPHSATVQVTSGTLIAAGTYTTALTVQTLPGDPGNVWLRLDGSTAAPNTGVLISGHGGSRSFGAPGFPLPTGAITAITDGGAPQTVLISGG
jgi:hypothetical protein